MGDVIRSAIIYLLVVALIIGFFKLLKMHERVTLEPNDHYMDELEYSSGNYRIKTGQMKAEDYKAGDAGDVVAYWVPGKPDTSRVARVLALPGERVEIERKNPADSKSLTVVKVNGTPLLRFKIDHSEWRFPEIVVPRGCLFLLADKPSLGEDSMQVGPVPYFCVRGRVN